MAAVDMSELKEKFPNLRPIRSAPSLFTVNGIGLSMYGRRDYDAETRTYIKTHCLCVVFVPIIPLAAYRVADAGGGSWYFLGRERLSTFARIWNKFLLVLVLVEAAYLGISSYTSSPEYIAGRKLAEADSIEAEGKHGPAVTKYREVAFGNTKHAQAARAAILKIEHEQLLALPASEALILLNTALDCERSNGTLQNNQAAYLQQGRDLLARHRAGDPAAALNILGALVPLGLPADEQARLREELLVLATQKDPQNLELVSELATLYESRKDIEKCEQLLTPLKDKLGASEGARILGQIYARQEKTEDAFKLLSPYAAGRLQQLHAAEQNYENAIEAAYQSQIGLLRRGIGPQTLFRKLEVAKTDEEKQNLLAEHMRPLIPKDPGVQNAQKTLQQHAGVISVALELGILRLNRAQGMAGDARKKELQEAEKLFLAIRGSAGETDEYKLFFGQVQYWLGKQKEGKEQFESLLASSNRSYENLLRVSGIYRELGDSVDAKALAEEAYKTAADQNKKYAAAHMRALCFTDLDDQIAWLNKSNKEDPSVAATLNFSLGNKALREGRDAEALDYLRKCADAYAREVRNATSLNNGGLAWQSVYELSYDTADIARACDMLEEGLSLHGSDAILCLNTGSTLMIRAVHELVSSQIDCKALRPEMNTRTLRYFYHDEAGRQQIRQKLKDSAFFNRALKCFEKLLIIAPQNQDVWDALSYYYYFAGNDEALQDLAKRLPSAQIDYSYDLKKVKEEYDGTSDTKNQAHIDAQFKRLEQALTPELRQKDPLSYAIGLAKWSENRLEQKHIGKPVELDKVVARAAEAFALRPSGAVEGIYDAALCVRAVERLSATCDAVKQLKSGFPRSMSGLSLLSFAAYRDSQAAAAIVHDPDVRKFLELERGAFERFPKYACVLAYPLFKASDPAFAASLVERVRAQPIERLNRELNATLNPANISDLFTAFFANIMEGREAEAWKYYEAARKAGVPLPPK